MVMKVSSLQHWPVRRCLCPQSGVQLLLAGRVAALELGLAYLTRDVQELDLLDDDAGVYKLVGPALIKQDPVEAKSNVQKRLDYITGELTRLEGQLKGLEEKQLKKQQQVGSL